MSRFNRLDFPLRPHRRHVRSTFRLPWAPRRATDFCNLLDLRQLLVDPAGTSLARTRQRDEFLGSRSTVDVVHQVPGEGEPAVVQTPLTTVWLLEVSPGSVLFWGEGKRSGIYRANKDGLSLVLPLTIEDADDEHVIETQLGPLVKGRAVGDQDGERTWVLPKERGFVKTGRQARVNLFAETGIEVLEHHVERWKHWQIDRFGERHEVHSAPPDAHWATLGLTEQGYVYAFQHEGHFTLEIPDAHIERKIPGEVVNTWSNGKHVVHLVHCGERSCPTHGPYHQLYFDGHLLDSADGYFSVESTRSCRPGGMRSRIRCKRFGSQLRWSEDGHQFAVKFSVMKHDQHARRFLVDTLVTSAMRRRPLMRHREPDPYQADPTRNITDMLVDNEGEVYAHVESDGREHRAFVRGIPIEQPATYLWDLSSRHGTLQANRLNDDKISRAPLLGG